jgi:hypothetical protein
MAAAVSPQSSVERKLMLMSKLHLQKVLAKPLDQMLTTEARKPLQAYFKDIYSAVKNGYPHFGTEAEVKKVKDRLLGKFTKKRNVGAIYAVPLNNKSPDVIKTTPKPRTKKIKSPNAAAAAAAQEQALSVDKVLKKFKQLFAKKAKQIQEEMQEADYETKEDYVLDMIDELTDGLKEVFDELEQGFKKKQVTREINVLLDKLSDTLDELITRFEANEMTVEDIVSTMLEFKVQDLRLQEEEQEEAEYDRFDKMRADLISLLEQFYPQDKFGNSKIDKPVYRLDPITQQVVVHPDTKQPIIDKTARKRFFEDLQTITTTYLRETTPKPDKELLQQVRQYFYDVIKEQPKDTLPSTLLKLLATVTRGQKKENLVEKIAEETGPTKHKQTRPGKTLMDKKQACLRLFSKEELQQAIDNYDMIQRSAPKPAKGSVAVMPAPAPVPAPVLPLPITTVVDVAPAGPINVMNMNKNDRKQLEAKLRNKEQELLKKQTLLDKAQEKDKALLRNVVAALQRDIVKLKSDIMTAA